MIRELRIRNCALIEDVAVEFDQGFSVFTGETGAGKSILAGAIGLVLGDRASAEVIRSGADEADVHAVFDIAKPSCALTTVLDEQNLSLEDGCLIVRRRITRNGKNRIHVNQTPVSLAVLKTLGDVLVDFHSQHEHQSLLYEDTPRQIVDSLPGVRKTRISYDADYDHFVAAREALERHDRTSAELNARRDVLEFQYNEINALGLHAGEERELESELKLLSSSSERLASVAAISSALSGPDESLLAGLGTVRRNLEALKRHDAAVAPWLDDLEIALSTIAELETFCGSYAERVQAGADPDRLEFLNARIAKIQKLKKKYQLSVEQLLEKQHRLRTDLDAIQNTSADRGLLAAKEAESLQQCRTAGVRLTQARKAATEIFDRSVAGHMERLGFAGGSFSTRFSPAGDPTPQGLESLDFLVRTNPGEPFLPLAKTASGGEISRLMLAIKTVLSDNDCIPVLVFDEIDTGVGGMLANEVARSLYNLGRSHQVLCISHLHQIASIADHHYRVHKEVSGDRTITRVTRLEGKEQVNEIARMLGDDSEISRRHARELLGKK